MEIEQYLQKALSNPECLLPQNLEKEVFDTAFKEIEQISQNPEVESPWLVNITLMLSQLQGEREIAHEEITRRMQVFIKLLSLERLKRAGLIKRYEEPTLTNLFEENREFDVVLEELKKNS